MFIPNGGNKFILMLKNPEFYASKVFVRGILWINRNLFKGHQLHHFLDFTCKIGGFNVYHKQNWTIVKHPELYTSHIFVTSIQALLKVGPARTRAGPARTRNIISDQGVLWHIGGVQWCQMTFLYNIKMSIFHMHLKFWQYN